MVHDPGVELVAEVLKVPGAKLYPARCSAVAIVFSFGHHRRRTHSVCLSEPVVHVILLQLTKGYILHMRSALHNILLNTHLICKHIILCAESYGVPPSFVYKFASMLLENICDSDHLFNVCWVFTLQCFSEPSAEFAKGFENLLRRAVCFWVNNSIFLPFVLRRWSSLDHGAIVICNSLVQSPRVVHLLLIFLK